MWRKQMSVLSLFAAGCLTVGTQLVAQDGGSYRQPLLVQSYEVKAVVPSASPLDEIVRSQAPYAARGPATDAARRLAAEVIVVVKRFRPRAIDPGATRRRRRGWVSN